MKTIRTQLQLTQRELAALLGISASIICMYEKGQRNLPAKALKLAQLQLQLQQTPLQKTAKLHARQQAHLLKVEKVLNAHARKAAADALCISLLLSKMQERYNLLCRKLAFIQELMQEATPATRQMSLLQNMELDVQAAMDHCGPARQQVAAYKLATLKARQQAALQTQYFVKQTLRG
ncbi:hypothetical protein A8C56_17220 [Niabella ginsenosidivorans]|uniref:HTH cro/C1-type domain-containing protein n=1 Tax=Niabella ginsenosidivorans TaxID=1176587 RepID=A0A1A9I4D0_9BACT|nr:helix-turn-helix transcriptional regulator [Niabella ginsenosidivorans]ANH82476.1 hypothetical protein A8C56_17220 [Niabella ginsenosidivorans]